MTASPSIPGLPASEGELTALRARLRAALGPVGVWSFGLQAHPAADAGAAMRAYESSGYGGVWFPETLGSKEALAHAGILLAGSRRAVVGTGCANIYARDPMAMMNGGRALAEAYPGRFVLTIGVSHAPIVAARGATYGQPIEQMGAYLDGMAAAPYSGPEPVTGVPVVLAALGPRMLELAAQRAAGAHPYFVPVEYTAAARDRVGPDPLLVVEVTGVLDTDRGRARETARAFATRYLALENYTNNLRRLGWSDEELAGGGSDRLLGALVAQGDAAAIAERVRAHLDAGADHVCLQLRSADAGDLALEGYAAVMAAGVAR